MIGSAGMFDRPTHQKYKNRPKGVYSSFFLLHTAPPLHSSFLPALILLRR